MTLSIPNYQPLRSSKPSLIASAQREWRALAALGAAGLVVTALSQIWPATTGQPQAVGQDGATPAANRAGANGAPAPAVPAQVFQPLSPEQAIALNAAAPFSSGPNPMASPFRMSAADVGEHARALTCLTMAVYYEAASQTDQGEAAVAQVVLNRVRNPMFPKTICGVVFQGSQLPTGCQFTFTCDGSLRRQPSADGWARAQRIAQGALDGHVVAAVGDATHYHTDWVVPYWQASMLKVTQIGAHIFYRWAGPLGGPGAFTRAYAGRGEALPKLNLGPDPQQATAQTDQPAPVDEAGANEALQTAIDQAVAMGATPVVKVAATAQAHVPAPPPVQIARQDVQAVALTRPAPLAKGPDFIAGDRPAGPPRLATPNGW